jgi:hypothetical protein
MIELRFMMNSDRQNIIQRLYAIDAVVYFYGPLSRAQLELLGLRSGDRQALYVDFKVHCTFSVITTKYI